MFGSVTIVVPNRPPIKSYFYLFPSDIVGEDRQTHRQTDIDRQTDRQTTDRHSAIDRQIDRQTQIHTNRQTDKQKDKQTIDGNLSWRFG